MGNDSADVYSYPNAYPGVISVIASDPSDKRGNFSNYGAFSTIAAPGVQIISSIPRGSVELGGGVRLANKDTYLPYEYWNGTSMATPYVSAMIALLKDKYPNITNYQIIEMLKHSTAKLKAGNERSGFDITKFSRIDKSSLLLNPSDYAEKVWYDVPVIGENGALVYNGSLYLTQNKIMGVDVQLVGETELGKVIYPATTDSDGIARFRDIPTGSYNLIVGGPDYLKGSPAYREADRIISLDETVKINSGYATHTTIKPNLTFSMTLDATLDSVSKAFVQYSFFDAVTGNLITLASSDTINSNGSVTISNTLLGKYGQDWVISITKESTTGTVTVEGKIAFAGNSTHEIKVEGINSNGDTLTFIHDKDNPYLNVYPVY